MEYRHLKFFLTVADELHFTRAAARLGIAQPHVSQEIRRLEKELGVELFVRSRRRVELTAAGRAFRAGALEVLAATERAVGDARRAARGETGRLTVGFAGSAGYDVFPEAVRRFRARWPGVELLLREMTTVDQLRALLEGAIDVALGRPRVEPKPGIELEIVRREAPLVALPTSHALARRSAIELRELADEGWIVFDRTAGQGLHTMLAAACQEAGFELRVVQEVGEIPTMINLVAGGMGVAMVPEPVGRLMRDGVVFKPLEGAPAIPLGLMWRRGSHEPAIQNFVELVLEVGKEGIDH